MTHSATASKIRISVKLCTIFGILLLLSGCGNSIHPYRVAGESMLPLLRPGDRIFVVETDYARSDLHDGDVIVLRRDNAVVIKRILALPGETISGEHRKVFRDGKLLDEPYLAPATGEEIAGLATFLPRRVGAGEIFVMGDNRDLSLDSRMIQYGPVKLSDVVGKYTWTYWHATATAKSLNQ